MVIQFILVNPPVINTVADLDPNAKRRHGPKLRVCIEHKTQSQVAGSGQVMWKQYLYAAAPKNKNVAQASTCTAQHKNSQRNAAQACAHV